MSDRPPIPAELVLNLVNSGEKNFSVGGLKGGKCAWEKSKGEIYFKCHHQHDA